MVLKGSDLHLFAEACYWQACRSLIRGLIESLEDFDKEHGALVDAMHSAKGIYDDVVARHGLDAPVARRAARNLIGRSKAVHRSFMDKEVALANADEEEAQRDLKRLRMPEIKDFSYYGVDTKTPETALKYISTLDPTKYEKSAAVAAENILGSVQTHKDDFGLEPEVLGGIRQSAASLRKGPIFFCGQDTHRCS